MSLRTRRSDAAGGAEYLTVHPDTLFRWSTEGKVAYSKLGNAMRFRKTDLDDFMERESVPAQKGTLDVLHDPKVPPYMTEGVKKALAAVRQGYLTLCVHGVWNWQKKDIPIDDLKRVIWRRRDVYIAFDSDAAQKEGVRLAQFRLAVELERRGTYVRILQLPPQESGAKNGLDDFLVSKGRESLAAVIQEANTLPVYEGGRIAEMPEPAHRAEIRMLLHVCRLSWNRSELPLS